MTRHVDAKVKRGSAPREHVQNVSTISRTWIAPQAEGYKYNRKGD